MSGTASLLVMPCARYKAVEVLVLGEDSMPLAGVAIQLRDGAQAMQGRTGPDGLTRFEGLDSPTFQICPYELDQLAWALVRTEPLSLEQAECPIAATWGTPVAALPETSGAEHSIASGQSVDVIAFQQGHMPATLWDHASNATLRSHRESGNVLLERDRLFVPPIQRSTEDTPLATRLVLQRRGVPSRIRLRLLDDLRPLSQIAWMLEMSGQMTCCGQTDSDGIVEAFVVPDLTAATLSYVVRGEQRRVSLAVGKLTPAHALPGWRQRLHNLGFPACTAEPAQGEAAERAALLQFQDIYALPLTGMPDKATLDQLYAVHDGAAAVPPPSPPTPGAA